MLTAFRPGTVVSARAASPFPAQIFIAPDGIPRGGAPITQVRHQLGSLTRAAHAPSSVVLAPSVFRPRSARHSCKHRRSLASASANFSRRYPPLSFSRPLVMNLVKEVRLPDSAPAARFLHFFLRPLAVLLIHVPQAVDRFNCV